MKIRGWLIGASVLLVAGIALLIGGMEVFAVICFVLAASFLVMGRQEQNRDPYPGGGEPPA